MERFLDYFRPNHYKINLEINANKNRMAAHAQIVGKTKADFIKLHASKIRIESIKIDDKEADFERSTGEITINKVKPDQKIVIDVDYSAPIESDMQGVYLSTYQNGENVSGEWIVIGKGTSVAGDVNGDGECTGSDVTALYNFILSMDDSAIVNGDQNGDGEITGSDVTAVYNIILGLN